MFTTVFPAYPVSDAELARRSRSSFLWMPIAFALVVGLAIAIVAWKVFLAVTAGSLSPRIKLGPDGFTLFAPRARPGETIRYRYVVDGRSETGEMSVPADPSQGMFVFTGARPSKAEVMNVLAAPGAHRPERPRGAVPPPPRETPLPSRRDDDDDGDSFRGFPSAY